MEIMYFVISFLLGICFAMMFGLYDYAYNYRKQKQCKHEIFGKIGEYVSYTKVDGVMVESKDVFYKCSNCNYEEKHTNENKAF